MIRYFFVLLFLWHSILIKAQCDEYNRFIEHNYKEEYDSSLKMLSSLEKYSAGVQNTFYLNFVDISLSQQDTNYAVELLEKVIRSEDTLVSHVISVNCPILDPASNEYLEYEMIVNNSLMDKQKFNACFRMHEIYASKKEYDSALAYLDRAYKSYQPIGSCGLSIDKNYAEWCLNYSKLSFLKGSKEKGLMYSVLCGLTISPQSEYFDSSLQLIDEYATRKEALSYVNYGLQHMERDSSFYGRLKWPAWTVKSAGIKYILMWQAPLLTLRSEAIKTVRSSEFYSALME